MVLILQDDDDGITGRLCTQLELDNADAQRGVRQADWQRQTKTDGRAIRQTDRQTNKREGERDLQVLENSKVTSAREHAPLVET